jgi:hypothetical protein
LCPRSYEAASREFFVEEAAQLGEDPQQAAERWAAASTLAEYADLPDEELAQVCT